MALAPEVLGGGAAGRVLRVEQRAALEQQLAQADVAAGAALWSGVWRSVVLSAFGSAPTASSSFASSPRPASAASCNRESPAPRERYVTASFTLTRDQPSSGGAPPPRPGA